MDYKAQSCASCGSGALKLISHKLTDGNVFYTYRCEACGETFSTETAYLARKAREEKRAAMEQAAKQKKAVPAAPSGTLDAPEIYRRNRNSVVELTADKGDCVGSGTGMVLPGGYVLTNAHVVFSKEKENATRVQAAESLIGVTADKRRFAFDIVYADVRRDMALIVSDDLAAPAVTFADGDVTIGEKVYAIGNSKGQGICMLDGIVSDRERFISGERYIMYSAPTVGGNSGGPLFNAHGEVIGMVTLGQKDGSLMNYAIPTPVLKAFLREAEEKEGIVI